MPIQKLLLLQHAAGTLVVLVMGLLGPRLAVAALRLGHRGQRRVDVLATTDPAAASRWAVGGRRGGGGTAQCVGAIQHEL